MPELAEVETVLRTLEKQCGHPTILDVKATYEPIIDNLDFAEFKQQIVQETIVDYQRLGKYLIFILKEHVWIVHLRMEGKFYLLNPDVPLDKHTHIVFTLDNQKELRYHDTRKFGRMYLYPKQENIQDYPCFKHVGYDLFDERLDAAYLYQRAKHHTYTLKQFLLDQNNLAGIGNIYADEICFACRLHPCTKVNRLSKKDCAYLLENARRILSDAILAGGTTIHSFKSSYEVDGRFQLQLKVHARKGESCPLCGTIIEKKQVAGRGTYFCRNCQKRK